MYPLRKCNNPPGEECLYYHMGQCIACGKEPAAKDVYEEIIKNISSFLQGGYQDVKKGLKQKMYEASENLQFERAQELRDQINSIDIIMEQQKMVLSDRDDRDIFGFSYDKGWMCVQVFFIRQGKLIERDVAIFPFFDEPQEAFSSYIGRFYLHQNHPKPAEVLLPVGSKDRKSTRLNSSHVALSYDVFCLKNK